MTNHSHNDYDLIDKTHNEYEINNNLFFHGKVGIAHHKKMIIMADKKGADAVDRAIAKVKDKEIAFYYGGK